MTDDEKYLFDLNGYIVAKGILKEEEIRLANGAIDRHFDQGRVRSRDESLDGWEGPWCNPFREMLAHPRLIPYLHEILGKGFRMDHQMSLIWMDKGAEGHHFHGSSGPHFDPNQYYIFRNGKMHNGLTVVEIKLTDVNPGDGGLIVVPGSHKGNFPCPKAMKRYENYQDHVRQVVCKAGDAVIFTEATTHGAIPWKADHQRRSVLTRYTAGNLAYVPAYPMPEWANERHRTVMEPPYHSRLDRPVMKED